jgi:cell wall-associated NlpC family hydrolase
MPTLSHVTRAECMDIADAYRLHRWTPSAANVRHCCDAKGIRVDTPDVSYNPNGAVPGWWTPGTVNEGVPYQWGGFSSIKEFDAGVAQGRAAGDVYTGEKRRLLDDAVSADAVGIDCSGYISRCWKLPQTYSTRELPLVCTKITWDELKPGDILNTHNAHCVLFAGWLDGKRTVLLAYETGCPPTWKVVRHGLDAEALKKLGYACFRYNGML